MSAAATDVPVTVCVCEAELYVDPVREMLTLPPVVSETNVAVGAAVSDPDVAFAYVELPIGNAPKKGSVTAQEMHVHPDGTDAPLHSTMTCPADASVWSRLSAKNDTNPAASATPASASVVATAAFFTFSFLMGMMS